MALRFAILTALSERDSTGFELARRFDRAFGYLWSASHQQIYRELARLQADGLVSEAPEEPKVTRGQPRRATITPAGSVALREWLAETDEPSAPREAIMIRLRAAAATGAYDDARTVILHHLDVHERTYAAYREIEERDFTVVPTDGDALRHLVLKGGLIMERAWIEWCGEALSELDRLAGQRSTTR